jgi:eukaryotic-like serine/threonine-protein kinase
VRRSTTEAPLIKGFTFIKVLGSGGFSDVFLYEQELPRRKVAVKVLLADDLTATTRSAFVAEANLMAQLSAHPYIVTIFHADVADDGRPFFIMEYCSGPSMSERYKREPFAVVEALRTGVRLSSAIATAHGAGILHRDIKPANVLTNDYGWPALTDFGISSAVEEDLPTHTTTRQAVGDSGATTGSQSVGMSIPWSPPEMFDEDPQPDVRSDVFSLAATVYTLLAGRTPFEVVGKSNQGIDLMSRIERGVVTPMDRTDVPATLLAVLRKGMATNREQRFASAVDFALALQRVEMELSYAPTAIDVPNLDVLAPSPRVDDTAEDATRARPVTSIAAQGPRAPQTTDLIGSPPPSGGASVTPASSPEAGATVMRRPVPVVSGSVAENTVRRPSSAAASAEPSVGVGPPARSRKGVIAAVSVGIVVIAAGGAIALATVLSGSVGSPEASANPGDSAGTDDGTSPVVEDFVPTPVLVSKQASADGTSVVFVWSNPAEVEGDTYSWSRTDGPDDQPRLNVNEPTVTIAEVTPGSRVCIEVSIRRIDGTTSLDPLEECVP